MKSSDPQPEHQQPFVQGSRLPQQQAGSSPVPEGGSQAGDSRAGTISLPTGGGAIRGIGEKFTANPVTGTASFTVPIAMSEGRGGFTPQLALSYDSGSGNSAFGLGWSVGLPAITRKTDKGLPQYNDNRDSESDVFILSGAEDLVPVLNPDGTRQQREEANCNIYAYRPRVEGLFARIERWEDKTTHMSHWRSVGRDNITTIYGRSENARIADPDNVRKVFSWLIERSSDAKGNVMRFTYRREDGQNVAPSCYEHARLQADKFANIYLDKVLYGNTAVEAGEALPEADFLFKLQFDYGWENGTWPSRQDPFSNYRSGFEIRTYRLCRSIGMYHNLGLMPEWASDINILSGQEDWLLVKSTDLTYDETKAFTLLTAVQHAGYDGDTEESLPPLTFDYTEAAPADAFKEVAEENLRGVPAGVDGSRYQWADLYSEGVSGILSMSPQAWYFKPNYGDKRFTHPQQTDSEPLFGGMKKELEKPAVGNSSAATFQLGDVNSDGLPELILQGKALHGFYSRDVNGQWLKFRDFKQYPNIDTADASIRFMDLSGDGLADIIISRSESFDIYFSMGTAGYGNYRRVHCAASCGAAPQLLFSDGRQRLFLADMSGDGLTDLVRISPQGIVYYPNMGYGRFGEAVVMGTPPLLDSLEQWDARHVFLADVDGTGTTDLLYISKGKISYYKNLSGNAWEEVPLPSTIACNHTPQTHIDFTDLLGNGTQCLVVSSSLPATKEQKMRYWELTGGIKPFLLKEIDNSMGGITRLHYAPSTKYYMRDKLSGKPWITRLPFPVHVLEKVETEDLVAGTLFTNRYAYHHGYYDRTEREFRGFGMVEQWDTEEWRIENEKLKIENVNSQFSILNSQPSTVNSQLSTVNSQPSTVNSQLSTVNSQLSIDNSLFSILNSQPSTVNSQLSTVNSQLSTVNSQFSILNSQFSILNSQLQQPPVYTKTWFHTGFFRGRDRISRLYAEEYWQGDAQAWLLPDTVLPAGLSGEEAREACRALKGSPLRIEIYAQDGSDREAIPYTVEEKNYSLRRLQPQSDRTQHAVFLKTESETLNCYYEREAADPRISHTLVLETDDWGNPVKQAAIAYPRCEGRRDEGTKGERREGLRDERMLEQSQWLGTYTQTGYINHNALDYRLLGIPYETKQYQLHNLRTSVASAYSKITIEELLAFIEDATVIDYAATPSPTAPQLRLIQHSRNYFWNEAVNAPLPLGAIAPHALPYQQQSLELTPLLIDQYNTDGVKLTATLLQNDCKYLKDTENNYWKTTEIQHFTPQGFYQPDSIIDPFGNSTAIEYDPCKLLPVKVTDALGFETMAEYDYRVMQPWRLSDPNGNRQSVAFSPLGMVTKLAVMGKNSEGDTMDDPTETYEYNLHCWQQAQQPCHAHISKRETHADPNTRWMESYVYTNGLGQEIMTKTQCADGATWEGTPCDDRWVASGKTILDNKGNPVMQYEPWFADNFGFEYEAHGVTPIMHYDPLGRLIQTDFPDGTTTKVAFTVWQQKNYDQNDCDENSSHYNTPQVIDLDVLGRPFQTKDDNGTDGAPIYYTTHNRLDITGRPVAITDAKERLMTQNLFALSEKHLLKITNIDSGARWLINDTADKPVRKWDSRAHEFRYLYDELQRPTDTIVNGACTEKIVYGTDAQKNNIGQIKESYAQDGITSFEYDFKGNIITQTKQFLEDYQSLIDWNTPPVIFNSQFSIFNSYDALNRPVTLTQPDGTNGYYGYDKGGLLATVHRNETDIHISNIEYNEKGQRLNIYYGNETKTRYYYNPLNFRLTRILTTRNTGQDTLQDLNYTYDAVGNIIEQRDDAQQTNYFDNQVVAPTSTYTYDALYRLTKATGRELTALTAPTHEDFANDIPCPDSTGNAMQNYTQNYQYDELGNILQMQSAGKWVRDYIYDTATNRLLKHDANQTTDDYTYDEHGNATSMPHLFSIHWSYKDELLSAGNGTFISYYNYDAQGNRTRKVVEKGNIVETRYYIGGYEVFRKEVNGTLDLERTTLNISDDEKVFVRVETKSGEEEVVRYQYDNHLGSACLELDETGGIISYEEYHPFGTTSYRSGKNETEVSLKRYKYCGKERDEETGFYYYGMRYYAAWLCRFISVDPLQFKYPYYTPYQYAGNKPITFIDLDGGEEKLPWYLTENKYGGKPVLTLGLGELPTMERNSYVSGYPIYNAGVFVENSVASAWNSIASLWNEARVGKTGSDMLMESDNTISNLKIEDVKAMARDVRTYENIAGGIATSYLIKRISSVKSSVSNSYPISKTNGLVKFGITSNKITGNWVSESTKGWSKRAIAYQEHVTGAKAGSAFKIDGVKFDGIKGNTLLEAKSSYDNFVKNGQFVDWFKGKDALIDQAQRQLKVANGNPIEWHFSSQETLKATQKLFTEKDIKGIKLIHNPQ